MGLFVASCALPVLTGWRVSHGMSNNSDSGSFTSGKALLNRRCIGLSGSGDDYEEDAPVAAEVRVG